MRRSTAAPTDVEPDAAPSPARVNPRTEQIARAAANLFQELGYQNVSIDQIGAAVGLTGPAVYRHFKGKHGILVHALMTQVQLVDALSERADRDGSTPREQLDLFLGGLADLTANGDEATLWRREQRHLEPAEREEFRRHFARIQQRIAGKIMDAAPGTDAHKAELLGFAILAMYSNTPDIRGSLSTERLMLLQIALSNAILACTIPDPDPRTPTTPMPVPRQPAGRRERIIDASAKLFDERGFYDVRIDDIAKASEMSVATLYQHVTGKAQVLRAVLERGAEGLLYVTADALAVAGSPDDVLDALISTYVRQALGIHGRIMHILSTDLLYLSDEEQGALRETQREYVAEWIAAIRALSEGLDTIDARALAQAVIGVLTDITQTPRLRERPGIAEELRVLARAMALPPGFASL